MQEQSHKYFDSFILKMIAIISMTIDHIGYIFLPGTPYYALSRGIGRIAFPIFCFLIVEGYHHTKSPISYLLRLSIFALLSEIPFDLAFRRALFDWQYQNVFFTLAIGLACLFCLEEMRAQRLYAIGFVLLFAASLIIHCDYGPGGVLVICMFYLTHNMKDRFWIQLVLCSLIFLLFFGKGELPGLIALFFIFLYNGKRGYNKMQWFFYFYYPLHLLVLYALFTYL